MNAIIVTYISDPETPLTLLTFPAPLACSINSRIVVRNEANTLTPPPRPTHNNHLHTLPGDNSAYEFSGWQKAINSDFFQKTNEPLWCLANDSFPNAGAANTPVITPDILARLSATGGLAGRLRRLPVSTRLSNLTLDSFIQTHLFLMHRDTIRKLGSLVSEPSVDPFLHPDFRPDPFTAHPVWTPAFKDFVFKLLTQRWHGHGMPFTPENYPFFRRKVLSILNELCLTARVRQLGLPILNLTPLPWFFDSPRLIPILPGRPVAIAQVIRNACFRVMRR